MTDFRSLPLAADGFALMTLSTSAWALSTRFCVGNDVLPTGACTMPVLSTRNSTLPALISLIAWATFGVTVPVFGFGIRPRGPSTLPRRPTPRIMSGVATTASKSIHPPRIFSTTSSPPTIVRAGVLRFLLLVGAGNREHLLALAEAVGQDDRAAHHLVRVLRIDAQPHRQLHRLVELGELHLLQQRNRLLDRVLTVFDLRRSGREFLAVLCHVPPCGAGGSLREPPTVCRRFGLRASVFGQCPKPGGAWSPEPCRSIRRRRCPSSGPCL